MIEVNALGPLRKYLGDQSKIQIPYSDGLTLEAVKEQVSLPKSEQIIVIINDRKPLKDQLVQDGDVIIFMSPISGG